MQKRVSRSAVVVGRVSLLGVVALLAVAECSSESDAQSGSRLSEVDAREAIFSDLSERTSNADAIYIVDDLSDYLPNQKIRQRGRPAEHFQSAGIIEGSVTKAEVTASYRLGEIDDQGQEKTIRVAKDAEEFDWRTITMTVDVDRAWSREVEAGDEISIDYTTYAADPGAVLQGLKSLDQALLVIEGDNVLGDAQYCIAMGGELLGLVDDGQVQFPGMSSIPDGDFIGLLKTPARITTAANQPQDPIVMDGFEVKDTGD